MCNLRVTTHCKSEIETSGAFMQRTVSHAVLPFFRLSFCSTQIFENRGAAVGLGGARVKVCESLVQFSGDFGGLMRLLLFPGDGMVPPFVF